MSDLFGESAMRLNRVAAHVLGWRPDEFWTATPRELAAILSTDPAEGAAPTPIDRQDLQRLMEQDRHG